MPKPRQFLENDFFIILNHLIGHANFKEPVKILVAVSGGADSLALTLLLNKFCLESSSKIKLFAVTIDHKIRPESEEEAKEVHKLLKRFKIDHYILTSNLKQNPKGNIEAVLRKMRYEMLYEFCLKHDIKYLFLGHHQGDAAENFLIRLFRGSGIDGLCGISEISNYKKVTLVRPLLSYSKEQLQSYLKDNKIDWLEDLSNLDEKFTRNKIRQFLNGFEDKSLITLRIQNAISQIKQSKMIIDELLLLKALEILKFSPLGYFLIEQKKFSQLEKNLALKMLALLLIEVSGAEYKPRLENLTRFYEYIINFTLDAANALKAKNFYGCMIEQYDNKYLIIYREKKAININQPELFSKNEYLIDGRFITAKNKQRLTLFDPNSLNLFLKRKPPLLIKFADGNKLEVKSFKNPLKKVFYTIPFALKLNNILQIPKFYFRTILKRVFDENNQ